MKRQEKLFRWISAALLVSALLSSAACAFRPVSPFRPSSDTVTETEIGPQTTETSVDTEPPPVTTEATETTSPPIVEPVETGRVSFLAAGDNIIYQGTWMDAARGQKSGAYDFTKMYRNVRGQIEAADLAFINQETLMCGKGYDLSGYPQFNSPQQVGLDLLTVGFDIIGIANNHMADKRAAGLAATIAFWKTHTNGTDNVLIGGYDDQKDYETIRTMERNGIVIALLAYTYDTNISTKADVPVVPVLDREVAARQIAAAREIADIVIVFPHWGKENKFTPSEEETEWAQYLADCGADVIIGAHPHVIQPIVWLTAPSGRQVLCAYSLGNFLSEQARDYNLLGGMLDFDLVKMSDGEVRIENILFTPTVCHFNKSWTNVIYYLSDYNDKLGAEHAVNTYYGNGAVTMARLKYYLNSTVADEFLQEELRSDRK